MLSIRLLGEMQVARDSVPLLLPPSRKTRGLLAYLTLVDWPLRRERLCSMFWDVPNDPKGALLEPQQAAPAYGRARLLSHSCHA
jgi:DNA-binding SARP family transcriptional activator